MDLKEKQSISYTCRVRRQINPPTRAQQNSSQKRNQYFEATILLAVKVCCKLHTGEHPWNIAEWKSMYEYANLKVNIFKREAEIARHD
jgi:hypothetical protein